MSKRPNPFTDRFKGKATRIFGKSSAQPTHVVPGGSLPSTSASPGASSAPPVAVADPSPSTRPEPPPTNTRFDAYTAWFGLKPLQQVLTTASGLFGPLQPVINDLTDFFEVYKDVAAADSDFAALHQELQSLLETLNTSFPNDVPPVIAECVDDLCCSINMELDKISGRKKGGMGRRLWEADKDLAKARVCRDQIRGYVGAATLEIVGGHGRILMEQEKVLGDHGKRLDEQTKHLGEQASFAEEQAKLAREEATEKRLRALKPSLSACYKSSEAANLRRECTPNTRKDVLSDLDRWRGDPNRGNLFWMNGMAGTGKTTIANTLCAMLKSDQKLGASFFCTRQLPECRSVKLILPTIAYQLARFSPAFRDALSRALESDPDLRTKDLPTQLEGLILNPLRNLAEPLPAEVLIVIDALDECEERAGVEEILGVLVDYASVLSIKVFVSSRPEEEIRGKIGGTKSQVVLHELDKEIVKEDIGLYLREELKGTSVSDDQLAELVKRAGVLFIYAATVVRFIKSKPSSSGQQERLKLVLSTSTHENKIDELYSAVLEAAFNNPELLQPENVRMRDIVHTVVCAQEPLTADALAVLLQLDDCGLVLDALGPLWSVIHVSGSGEASLVTTLHASFPDYMLDPERSPKHGCIKEAHHGRLAELCFKRIERNKQQFNICGLESSYLFDEQVEGFEEKVKQNIPLALSYACQYWAAHLELGEWSEGRAQLLEGFLSKRLLMWMEVLNLKKRMNIGAMSLEKARKWCINGGDSEAIAGLIHDAWRFATTFATNPVSRSTPHIYVSMLASWPSSSPITDRYAPRAGGLAQVRGSGMTRRQLALLGVFPVGSEVYSVAFSPDGMRIICGCDDGTIRVWDAQSGKVVLGPLKGHTRAVSSVAFSLDGRRIASGSVDRTMRLWDAHSGKMVLEPLQLTNWVSSVAFSPDSARIVSGSYAGVCIWDTQSGQMLLGPLKRHSSLVSSLAFSPDSTRIVSGSDDKTILVWDSQTGQVMLGPLEGHTGRVNSVAFSPDGNQIVSGSRDRTVRVWDVRNGKSVRELEGHTSSINAVAFSPSGRHIVSGSWDKLIRVWDVRSGKDVLGPLEGHTDYVSSVAFSSDGMRIVSGSYDQTIRVWDAQSSEVASGPLEGHAQWVNSVAFAPDGTRVVSGSDDKTIWLWDAQSGKVVLGPLEGHTESVLTVAFFPDGTLIASYSSDNTIRVWDAQNGNTVLTSPMADTHHVSSVAFSPDIARIVSASNQTIHIWDVQTGKMLLGPLEAHAVYVSSVVFSPDGMQIVSGSGDQTLRMWDAQNGNMVLQPLEGHTDGVISVAFSFNGVYIVSGSYDRTLRVWDVRSGNMVLEPLLGHDGAVRSVAFSPDGMYIVSGSDDKTIRVWAVQTGELVLGPLTGHILSVYSVSFSPDSTHIVSGSFDKVIRVWRLPNQLLTANPEPRSSASPSPSRAVVDSPITQPSFFHQAPGTRLLPWVLNEDGWVVDKRQNLWLWVPPDLRPSLMMPSNTLVISTQGSVQLDFDGAAMGESWAGCYTPT